MWWSRRSTAGRCIITEEQFLRENLLVYGEKTWGGHDLRTLESFDDAGFAILDRKSQDGSWRYPASTAFEHHQKNQLIRSLRESALQIKIRRTCMKHMAHACGIEACR